MGQVNCSPPSKIVHLKSFTSNFVVLQAVTGSVGIMGAHTSVTFKATLPLKQT